MSQRDKITKYVLQNLGLPEEGKTAQSYIKSWWWNPRTKNEANMRLTESGHVAFQQAGLKSYQINFENPLPPNLSSKTLLQLNNYIDSPFYINSKSIEVYTEKMAIQLVLFSGDILKFLESKNRSKVAEKQQ